MTNDSWSFSMTHGEPATWFVCSSISKTFAANQFKAFGVVYRVNGEFLLDYEKLSQPQDTEKTPKDSLNGKGATA